MDELTAWMNDRRGNAAKLAKELGIFQSGLRQWRQVPAHHLAIVCRVTRIPAEKLRPDMAPVLRKARAA